MIVDHFVSRQKRLGTTHEPGSPADEADTTGYTNKIFWFFTRSFRR